MTEIPSVFTKFLRLFHSHHVEYLVVGGYAVIHYGYIRTTEDIDLWVARNPENTRKIIAALSEFGFTPEEVPEALFLNERQICRMGVAPFRIDIITSLSGVTFTDCYSRRQTEDYEGVNVPFISLEDLRINKTASGRYKDLADLENLPGHDTPPPRKRAPRTRTKDRRRRRR